MKSLSALLVLASIAAVSVHAEADTSGWRLADASTTCTSTCSNLGRDCDAARINSVTSTAKFDFVNNALGDAAVSCAAYISSSSSRTPVFASAHSGGTCYTQKAQGATCDRDGGADHHRICCCTTTAGDLVAQAQCPVQESDCLDGALDAVTHRCLSTANPTCDDTDGSGTDFATCVGGTNTIKSDLTGVCATSTCAASDCCDANPTCDDTDGSGTDFASCVGGTNTIKSNLTGVCTTSTCAASDCCDANPMCDDIDGSGTDFALCVGGTNTIKSNLTGVCATSTCAASDCCDETLETLPAGSQAGASTASLSATVALMSAALLGTRLMRAV